MENAENLDSLFRVAVAAIDAGDLTELERLLAAHPGLVRERIEARSDGLKEMVDDASIAEEGYFRQPYLLWFVAGNPIRNAKLPANIVELCRAIIGSAKREAVDSLQEQLNYTLALVCSGRVARECGVQTELIDVLIDAGASPGSTHTALAHKEVAAAERLIDRGAELTLTAAICLERKDAVDRLLQGSSEVERHTALAAAALYGKAEALSRLIDFGVDLSAYAPDGFHSHATPLHHAVDSGSLLAVKILVEAGAGLGTRDRIFEGTAFDWAEYLKRQEIAAYLRAKSHERPKRP